MSVYVENFKNNEDIIRDYSAPTDALDGAIVHLAWYGYGDYCGSSLVIFERNGILYEVNGSHCSCMGLEEQWKPEETSWEALAMRRFYGSDCEGWETADKTLQDLIKNHINEHKEGDGI